MTDPAPPRITISTSDHAAPEESPIRAVATDYVKGLAAVDPQAARALGWAVESHLPHVGPDDFDARREIGDRASAALSQAVIDSTHASSADLDLAAAMGERLAADALLDDSGFTQRLLAPLATPVQEIREVLEALPLNNEADAQSLAAELRRAPAALRDYRDTLRRAAARGHRVASRQVEAVARQCLDWCDPAGSDFFTGLSRATAALPAVSSATARAVGEGVTATRRAFTEFVDFLTDDLLPGAPVAGGVGRELYAVTARAFLGADVDLDETVDWGWSELHRIDREIRRAAKALHPDGLAAAIAMLDADPSRIVTGPREIEAWLTDSVAEIADAVDGHVVELPPAARLPRCLVSRSGGGVMYYSAPDPGLTRPGTIWWATEVTPIVHTWRERTTLLHEGIPGHHLQITTALTSELHPWQQALCHIHGYAEGWAHYSESWAADIGLLDDPADRLGMLIGQAWRAARIVIDAGLHLGLPIPAGQGMDTGRWTYSTAVDHLQRITGLGDRMASFEVDRYLGWPAQALSFRVGARLFSDIVSQGGARPGSPGETFHTDLLRRGPMGLEPLRTRLAQQPTTSIDQLKK